MSDLFIDPYRIVAARPPAFIVGWRLGRAVRNDEFLARIAAWHTLLQRTDGQNFALYIDDSIEFGAALLGAWLSGKTIWLTADTLPATCATMRQSVDGFLGDFASEWMPLLPPASESADITGHAIDADFIALVVHTSGTSGAAQAIPKRLTQLTAEIATLEQLFGSMLGDAGIVATVSHQHIYGFLFKVLWPLVGGRAIHARMQNFPEELLQLLQTASAPCALIASPAYLKRLPAHLKWPDAIANLRAVFSSGGPLPFEAAQAAGKLLGRLPIEVYGSSETGGIAWRQRTDAIDESWLLLPGVACRATDEQLLQVRSPHLADDDWLQLADRVAFQQDGRFLLQGRSDRIAKIEEKRISLDAIEAQLASSALVAEARILVCDEVAGQRQRLAAFVVLSADGKNILALEGKPAMNHRLRALLVDTVEPVALPRRWRYPDRLPVNAQGKTTHALLLALLDERPRVPQLRLIERDEKRVQLEIVVPPDLFYFDGHFPQAPILPGVVQVDWAIRNGREYFDLPLHFHGINALKFQHVIQADHPVTLELLHDVQKGSLNFRYFSPKGQHASGRILFTSETHA